RTIVGFAEILESMTEIKQPPRLMIVDDDEAVASTLVAVLQRAGYQTEWVTTGREALAKMAQGSPGGGVDIVFVDIRLPDMNGLDVLREGGKINPDLAAIVMTGYTDTETAIRALNAGALAYVQKPYHIDEVKATVSRLVERQSLVKQNRELVHK